MKSYSMKTLDSEEILALPFGIKIKIVYHKSKYHSKNDCGTMNPDKAIKVTRSEAEAMGLESCKTCF